MTTIKLFQSIQPSVSEVVISIHEKEGKIMALFEIEFMNTTGHPEASIRDTLFLLLKEKGLNGYVVACDESFDLDPNWPYCVVNMKEISNKIPGVVFTLLAKSLSDYENHKMIFLDGQLIQS